MVRAYADVALFDFPGARGEVFNVASGKTQQIELFSTIDWIVRPKDRYSA
ncbi:hypothetical protein [Phyllobacterium zundukense]